ncbi:Alpha/Beta hydrolase protein [Thelephora terrestris]|uniref:Carboxylic ester hydrolase n=1 Tax=Thelephora terrestris TaxID=56493 RepID=A0A9P6H4V8_9AGAM|nr:Alpha/Beta hydrolase protein [Thelephora terrestris]
MDSVWDDYPDADPMNFELGSKRSLWRKSYSALLTFLGILVITTIFYFYAPRLGISNSRPVDIITPHPEIQVDAATFIGTSSGGVDGFFGIPFAKPPTGDLRFRHPEPYGLYSGTIDATKSGPSCTQLRPKVVIPEGLSIPATSYAGGIHAVDDDSEDCLTLDVIKPAFVDPDVRLPVAVWFFGGGFQFGGTIKNNGIPVVSRSLELGEPIIFVVMNYRLNAFGFLASQEVKDAGIGNLGLHDQREALRWVQRHIGSFGGDPTKVTIWGQSAGAMSVSLQLVANEGDPEGLFRGAIMQSGAPLPIGDVTLGQKHYDDLVLRTSCLHTDDTLDCLRRTPYETLRTAIEASMGIFDYTSMALSWIPRPDGAFIASSPVDMIQDGRVARVPVINGVVNDEATLFTLSLGGIKTESELVRYLRHFHLPNATEEEMVRLLELYPYDPTQGSPYGTGEANQVTAQWKRLSSIQGDLVFQAPRRMLLRNLSPRQNTWSYLSRQLDGFPDLGTAHSSDLADIFGGGVMADYFIRFINTLDPNGSSSPRAQVEWPTYDTENLRLLTFLPDYNEPSVIVTDDNFRKEQIELFVEMAKRYRM